MLINNLKPRLFLSPDASAGGNNQDVDTTPKGESSTPDGGKQEDGKKVEPTASDKEQKKEDFIPRARFDEVYNELKSYKEKIASIDEAKKKAEETEALKRGEHEKVIADKDTEITTLKTTLEEKEKSAKKLAEISNARLDAFKTTFGEELLEKAKVLIASEDPLTILEKLPVLEELFKKEKTPSGGSSQPQGAANDKTRLQQLQERLEKGDVLGSREQAEYFKLLEDAGK